MATTHNRYLIVNGADPNLKDRFGATALDDAKRESYRDIIEFLSRQHAKVSLVVRTYLPLLVSGIHPVVIRNHLPSVTMMFLHATVMVVMSCHCRFARARMPTLWHLAVETGVPSPPNAFWSSSRTLASSARINA